jgi:hypothetical protein
LVFILTVYQQETSRHDHRWKSTIKNFFIGDLWYVGNNFIDGFTDGQSIPKKLYPLYLVGISIAEYNILLIEKSYVILSVIFFVRQ